MRHFLIICFLSFCGSYISAQALTHLRFKSIPLDGEISSFVSKMKSSGFIDHPNSGNYTTNALLKGTFAGLDNCTIKIEATPKSKIVYKVVVSTDYYTDWYSIESAYKSFLSSYRDKYSQISQCDFIYYPYNSVRGWEINAIFRGKYSLFTYFAAEGGEICVSVESDSADKAFIQISYEDKINKELNKAEITISSQEDI